MFSPSSMLRAVVFIGLVTGSGVVMCRHVLLGGPGSDGRIRASAQGVALSPLDRYLIEQLGSEDVVARTNAAKVVGARRLRAAVPALVRVIGNPEWSAVWGPDERNAALSALERIAPNEAARALTLVFEGDNHLVRCWGARAMAEYQLSGAAAAAIARLESGDVSTAYDEPGEIACGLRIVAPEQLAETLEKLAADGSPNQRDWALETLAKWRK